MEKPAYNDYPIIETLRQRWSPYAFAETPVAKETLLSLLEAARWAPSCFNEQPWRFIVGSKADDPATFDKILSTMVEFNRGWAQHAPVLILAVAKKTFTHNGAPNRHAPYDLGQAMGHLTIQASALGLVMHQMGGFDPVKASEVFGLSDDFDPIAIMALGFEGSAEQLEEPLKSRHSTPERPRKALADLILAGDNIL
ncbi:MAG: nitroreductase family protein [Armatimonas sp.]